MRFLRVAGALLLIAAVCEAVLIIKGTPGHSFDSGRTIMDAIASTLQLFGVASFGAAIVYPLRRIFGWPPAAAAVNVTFWCGLLAAGWAFHEWFSGGDVLWHFP